MCDKCGIAFKDKNRLRDHYSRVHSVPDQVRFNECESISIPDLLVRHTCKMDSHRLIFLIPGLIIIIVCIRIGWQNLDIGNISSSIVCKAREKG